MTRAIRVAALALALAASAGCSTHPCRPDSILATLVFDETSSSATTIAIQVVIDGKTLTATKPSAGSGTVEIDLPDHYAKGKQVLVTVTALVDNGTALGRGSEMLTLADSCSTVRIPIQSTSAVVNPPDMAGYGVAFPVAEQAKNKVDVLFMIDNSLSMDVPQKQLATDMPALIAPFSALAKAGVPTDVHIGVVTSDYGAGDLAAPAGQCQVSPGGQKGFLQGTGAAAATGCVAPTGSPYVSYTFDAAGDHGNLAVTATPDALAAELGCMTAVGAMGCGFEHQLESLYAGLHNTVENAGFLRADALLTVILLTNEDDGSAPPNAKFYESTADATVYGAYDTYRQTRFGVGCGGAPLPYPAASDTVMSQTWMHCAGLPSPTMDPNLAYDVSRYINYFTAPASRGGVKISPDDVIMVAIDAPETPFITLPVQRDTGIGQQPNPTYKDCGPMLSSTCVLRLQHSCQNVANPTFFGDPAVRINGVVSAAKGQSFNLCGDDAGAAPSYVKALTAAGQTTAAHVVGNCVTQKLVDPTHPDCQVIQTVGSDVTYLPSCAVGSPPCWTITSVPGCTPVSPDGVALRITRSAVAPAGATVTAWCKTQ